jgi:hypothetical protein
VVAIPVILSLAIGTWYMMGQGDVVTAWTLALYIVTTAAGQFPNRITTEILLTRFSAYCIDGDYWESEGYLGTGDTILRALSFFFFAWFWGIITWIMGVFRVRVLLLL